MKFLKSFILAFILMLATSNYIFSKATSTHQTIDSLTTAIIKVKGITCSMDLKMISINVEKIKGVNSCIPKKQGTTTTFEVLYNAELVTEKEIYKAIENTGSCENPSERPYKIKQ